MTPLLPAPLPSLSDEEVRALRELVERLGWARVEAALYSDAYDLRSR